MSAAFVGKQAEGKQAADAAGGPRASQKCADAAMTREFVFHGMKNNLAEHAETRSRRMQQDESANVGYPP
jgi:hypothetical protein